MRKLFIFISILVSGCFPLIPGDGGFIVNGTLMLGEKATTPVCLAYLLSDKDEIHDSHTVVGSRVKIFFMVPPVSEHYKVKIVCDNKTVMERNVDYGSSVDPSHPLELGNIVVN